MLRLLIYAALLVIVLMLLRRIFPRLGGGAGKGGAARRFRSRSGSAPDEVVCAECGTRYKPAETGWICPKCGR